MAKTFRVPTSETPAPVLARLGTTEVGQVAPDPAGYTLTRLASWQFEFAGSDSLSGVYTAALENTDGVTVAFGYVNAGDGAGPFFAEAFYRAAAEVDAATLPTTTRDAVLDRVLAGSHDAAGTLGKLIQDLPTTTRDAVLDRVLAGSHDAAGTLGKLIQDLPTTTRDAVLDRVLAGSHDAAGTLGKLIQDLPTTTRDAVLDRVLAGSHDAAGTLGWLVQQIRNLLEADQDLVDDAGVRKLKTFLRGTSTELIPAKTAKRTDGANLTDPATEKLSGYVQP